MSDSKLVEEESNSILLKFGEFIKIGLSRFLFGFLVRSSLFAVLAILCQLQTIFERLLVLAGMVVNLLAGCTLEFD